MTDPDIVQKGYRYTGGGSALLPDVALDRLADWALVRGCRARRWEP